MQSFFIKFLLVFICTLNIYALDYNKSIIENKETIELIQKQLSDLKKENTELKKELEKVEWKRSESNDNLNNRIESFGNYLETNAIAIGIFIGILGILMTVLVIYITFKSNKEAKFIAKEEAENEIDKWIENEAKVLMKDKMEEASTEIQKDTNQKVEKLLNEYADKAKVFQNRIAILQKESSSEIKALKNQFENQGNEIIENLLVGITDTELYGTELSIDDKKYFEYEIKTIKLKALEKRTFQDYHKLILFFIVSEDYIKSIKLIEKLLQNANYTKVERSLLYQLKGLTEQKQGFFDDAIESLSIAIELAPNRSVTYLDKARVYTSHIQVQNYEKAIELVNKAIELNNNSYSAYIVLGYAVRLKADIENKPSLYEESIKYYKKAIEINPDIDRTYNNIGVVHFMQNNYKEAKKYYYLSLEINPNEWAYVNLFMVLLFLNEEYPLELEEKYSSLFGNNKSEPFDLYQVLKIFKNISDKKYEDKKQIENVIEKWSKVSRKQRYYYFLHLENWIQKESSVQIYDDLYYAFKLLSKHRI